MKNQHKMKSLLSPSIDTIPARRRDHLRRRRDDHQQRQLCVLSLSPLFSLFHGTGSKGYRLKVSAKGEDVLQLFLKERQLSGDLITRVSDAVWWRDDLKLIDSENGTLLQNLKQLKEAVEEENTSGLLKLTETREWVSGDSVAPVNNRLVSKERQNDREMRKELNLLKYEALKRELMLLTTGIGASCTGYCLITLSVQAAISYAAGVLLSCLYLQLLYHHADCLTKETTPQVFLLKKSKKIGIRSEDLTNLLERILKGSTIALSSPRLIIPAAIYGLWVLSRHFFSGYFDFQLVPAMFGLFAYKAAALVQVYRDNKDLKLVFQDSDGDPIDS